MFACLCECAFVCVFVWLCAYLRVRLSTCLFTCDVFVFGCVYARLDVCLVCACLRVLVRVFMSRCCVCCCVFA